jgi:hypothetical protein
MRIFQRFSNNVFSITRKMPVSGHKSALSAKYRNSKEVQFAPMEDFE